MGNANARNKAFVAMSPGASTREKDEISRLKYVGNFVPCLFNILYFFLPVLSIFFYLS